MAIVFGAALHDALATSISSRVLGLAIAVLCIGIPLFYLLVFRCPRCGGVFLTTGGLRDFLGLARILWAERCGRCALPISGDDPPSSGELPESRPPPRATSRQPS